MNETVVAKSSFFTAWFGAFFALFQGMDSNAIAMWAGVAIAFMGMVINAFVNWYYKHKAHKLAEKIAGVKVDE